MLAERHDFVVQEQERLCALDRYDVLDTAPEEAFDRITRLARHIFNVPISAVTLIDGHRQWFKSRQGIDDLETDLPPSLCHKVVMQGAPLIVEDALADPRVQSNPCVTGDFGLRFYAGIPLRTPDGHHLGALCIADTKSRSFSSQQVEILWGLAQIVMSELELRTLATTDALTGALSRRAFKEEAGRAFSLAQRHGNVLSCLMLDVDHFKLVNDSYGHSAGDRVLAEVVGACRVALRTSDLIGRLGGEEFAILLHQTGREAASEVAEKLRDVLERLKICADLETINVTASFGVSTLDKSVPDIDQLIKYADSAVYESKAGGRNRCTVWKTPTAALPADSRRRVLKAGRIAFNGGRSTIDCTVRTLSEKQAGLSVVTTIDIPDRFKLQIPADNLSRVCDVIGRGERTMDVAFG